MQPAERQEFEAQVRTMFAGLGVSVHDNPDRLRERVEAWWIGLSRMSLTQFVRCMEHLLAEPAWPDYLPKKRPEMIPGDMWKVLREQRFGGNQPGANEANHVRNYWRGTIVSDMCWWLGVSPAAFEPILVAAKDTLGGPLRALLDELEQQDRRDGRTVGQHKYAQRITSELARQFRHLRTEHAPALPEQRQSEMEAFA